MAYHGGSPTAPEPIGSRESSISRPFHGGSPIASEPIHSGGEKNTASPAGSDEFFNKKKKLINVGRIGDCDEFIGLIESGEFEFEDFKDTGTTRVLELLAFGHERVVSEEFERDPDALTKKQDQKGADGARGVYTKKRSIHYPRFHFVGDYKFKNNEKFMIEKTNTKRQQMEEGSKHPKPKTREGEDRDFGDKSKEFFESLIPFMEYRHKKDNEHEQTTP